MAIEQAYKCQNVDLALTKFITAVSDDENIEEGEYLTADKTSQTPYTRQTSVNTNCKL